MSLSQPDSIITTLAQWSATLRYRAIAPEALAVAQRCVIDTLGVALAGSGSPVAQRARAVAMMTAGPGHSSLIGASAACCAPAAAFVNATAGHALDFDDNCNAGFVHGSVVIAPAALAVAQMGDLPGERLLAAFVAGAECEYALAQALTRRVYDQGWWTTALFGAVGACAAACHGLGLDAAQTAAAMAIALAGGSGLKAGFGTDAKPLMAGRASEAGVVAALLAQQGCSGPIDIVEQPRGLAAMFCGQPAAPVTGLGQGWRLLAPGVDIKRIPVCMSSHAAVDALVDLMAAHGLSAASIAEVVCDVPAIVMQNLAHEVPESPQHAQFSMNFALACTAVTGELTLASLAQATLDDPRIQQLMRRVRMHSSERWNAALNDTAPEGAWVKVLTVDGRTFERFCARHQGSASQPMPHSALRGKFLGCAGMALPAIEANALLHRLEHLPHLPSTRALLHSPNAHPGPTP